MMHTPPASKPLLINGRSTLTMFTGQLRCQIKGAVSIADRPAEVEARVVRDTGKATSYLVATGPNS